MTKEEAQTVKAGDKIMLVHYHKTPQRNFPFPYNQKQEVTVKRTIQEESGHVHFDLGHYLPDGEKPLKSLDTDEIINNTNIYWMHPSRFEKR